MNKTQQWLDSYYDTINTVSSKGAEGSREAASILKTYLKAQIKAFEFDDLEYILDSIILDNLPPECVKVLKTTLQPYCTEFEFWYEFVEEANKRIKICS
jgi:hypothetical protein